jgi:outer membrane protein OmpA-like peptidoglycan-associated protein
VVTDHGEREMMNNRTLLGLASIGLLLSACADQNKVVPADTSGKESVFTDGFAAMQNGDNSNARADFEQAYAAAPNDPYDEEDLAASYQNTGNLQKALPLYRNVIATAGNVYPSYITRPEVQGLSVAQVAEWNLRQAGVDQYGNAIQTGAHAQAAALVAPQEGTWQIFFDFDRANLTPQAMRTVHEAAASAKSGDLTRISLTGHTDTVGSDPYNLRLSERRAVAVEQALEAEGIAQADIVVHGVGKAGLLVPTPNGVREPQNRRVEIIEEKALVN